MQNNFNTRHNYVKQILSPKKDPMGKAIQDYFETGKAKRLRVFSSLFEEDEIPVKHLFRPYGDMPALEKIALQLAKGRILDVGAGSGCHALALQDMDKKVVAIDISPVSVEVMSRRGVKESEVRNFFDESFTGVYDTLLFLMNGSGIIGKIDFLPQFFNRLKQLLTPGGFVLMDSSDVRYLFENEEGSYDIDLTGNYYGEINFQMQYGSIKGESFNWLYIDFETLSYYASQYGFETEKIQEGKHYDYLAKISRKNS